MIFRNISDLGESKKLRQKGTDSNQSKTAPQKLKILFTIVNRQKAELYMDLLQSYEVNMQLSLNARGTAGHEMLNYLGLSDQDKTVIISVIRDDMADAALAMLDEKFRTIRNGKGIAYTVPMSSVIGVAIYQFLCNNGNHDAGGQNR